MPDRDGRSELRQRRGRADVAARQLIAPQHLTVLVALYRYYFYQHRLEDALLVAESTLAVVGRRLEFPEVWINLREANVGRV